MIIMIILQDNKFYKIEINRKNKQIKIFKWYDWIKQM